MGAVRIGALDLYLDHAGPLTYEQHADALVMADVAAQAVLMLQAEAPPGTLSSEMERGANFHYVVHQAAGMIAAQLDVSVGQALIRLRAHALGQRSFTQGRGREGGGQEGALRWRCRGGRRIVRVPHTQRSYHGRGGHGPESQEQM